MTLVHALKSASKQIGALQLSALAADMEKAGNEKNGALIHQYTESLLEQYLHLGQVLAPYFSEDDVNDPQESAGPVPTAVLRRMFDEMRAAIADLDFDQIETIVREMDAYSYEGWRKELFSQLKEAAEVLDVDTCESILVEWDKKEENHGD